MRGSLSFFSSPEEVTTVELPKRSFTVGEGAADWLRLAAGTAASATIEWTQALASWVISPSAGVDLNGNKLNSPAPLQHGDELRFGQRAFRVGLHPATPLFNSRETHVIPLGSHPIVFGRDTGEEVRDLVRLDGEAAVISRKHARIEPDGSGHKIIDESRAGSRLNGRSFEQERLVLGDRFLIGPYNFEYTGRTVRMVNPVIGARIDAANISVVLGGREILRRIHLKAEPCSFVGLLGGSGHGKSTVLNALCGLVPLASGVVTINGQTVTAESARLLGLGYVPQEDIVHPELTVGQALEYSARLRLDRSAPVRAIRELARTTAKRLGLEERWSQRISKLSGGQRKRVSIASELLTKPAALFLDEPSSGLDPSTESALMGILRRLAESDCTVIASTHVLGRAYLFDRLCFIRKGEAVYQGPPSGATTHFGVKDLDEIYLALDSDTPLPPPDQPPQNLRAPDLEPIAPALLPRPGLWRTLLTLFLRQARILAADPLNLLFLLAQPLAIGFLVAWVAESPVLRGFLAIISTLWFGTSNGAQQIVREKAVFRRERLCGLNVHAYLVSKLGFLSALTMVQAAILLVTLGLTALVFHPPPTTARDFEMKFMAMSALGPDETPASLPLWRALAFVFDAGLDVDDDAKIAPHTAILAGIALKALSLCAAACVGVALGLAISALAQSTTQSVMWVPLVLIPQILLGGFVVTAPEMSRAVRTLSMGVPSFAAQRIMDVAHIYGQSRPLLTNTTRRPQFLSGRKERVEWDGSFEQFDEPSRHNVSWQNLATDVEKTGQHKKQLKTSIRGLGVELPSERLAQILAYNQIYRDSVDDRNDVLIPRSTIYLDLSPCRLPLMVILAWLVVSYTIAAIALHQKQ